MDIADAQTPSSSFPLLAQSTASLNRSDLPLNVKQVFGQTCRSCHSNLHAPVLLSVSPQQTPFDLCISQAMYSKQKATRYTASYDDSLQAPANGLLTSHRCS